MEHKLLLDLLDLTERTEGVGDCAALELFALPLFVECTLAEDLALPGFADF